MNNDEVDQLLASQLGLITWRQARAAGLSPRQVQVRTSARTWIRVHPYVYRHAAAPVTHDQRLLAAVLAVGPGSAASHRAAIARWGLGNFGARLVEVSRPTRIMRPEGQVLVHRMPDLRRHHVDVVRNVPTTTPARTLVDAGMVMPPRFVARCMEAWLADRLVTLAELRRTVEEHAGKGRKGVGILRAALEDRALGESIADSGTEALLAEVLAAHGLPAPTHHYLVDYAGTVLAELDFAYVDEAIAIEVDGYGVHLASQDRFEHDRYRQNEIEVLGWHVLRFTHRMLVRTPGIVAGTVARMLHRRRTLRFHASSRTSEVLKQA
jgi:Protein of unknown function (DUF559)